MNNYINHIGAKSVEQLKCLAHIEVVMQFLRKAKEIKNDLVILWVEPCIEGEPCKLVKWVLQRYHVPTKIKDHIQD